MLKQGLLLSDFGEVTSAVLAPGNGLAPLPPISRMQFPTRTEIRPPLIPGLIFPGHTSWSVAADEQAESIILFDRIVPAFGLDRHGQALAQ